jgi:hypothetical protein
VEFNCSKLRKRCGWNIALRSLRSGVPGGKSLGGGEANHPEICFRVRKLQQRYELQYWPTAVDCTEGAILLPIMVGLVDAVVMASAGQSPKASRDPLMSLLMMRAADVFQSL